MVNYNDRSSSNINRSINLIKMVQLKSFKYIENSENNTGSEEQATTPSRSSSTVSNISSTISGGNLTSGCDETASTQIEVASSALQRQQTTTEDESVTLSSNEEFQIANHDIIEEENEEEEEQEELLSPAITRINLEASDSSSRDLKQRQQQHHQINLYINKANQSQQTNQATADFIANQQQLFDRNSTSASPLSPRIVRQQTNSKSGFNSPILSPLVHSMSAGDLPNKYGTNEQRIDSISEYSFIQRNLQQNNNFEIRWHNINLYACKKKPLSSFITENRIYKLLTGSKNAATKGDYKLEQQDLNISSLEQQHNNQKSPQASSKVFHSPSLSNRFYVSSSPSTAMKNFKTNADQLQKQQSAKLTNATSIDWTQVDLTKQILNNVSGSVSSGQLTAILGPSGVGKTTLLNSLTGRNTLEGTGRVLLLGSGANNKKRMSVVTVPQQDVLPEKLTVLEDLQFTSRLKNPQRNFDHKRNINRIVQHLFMEKFLNTRIDKLSGGEQRRLSIGRELLNSPDIMILDEPTSGLDANTCKKIITSLRNIVIHSDNILDKPMVVIVTIHQPQQEVFNLFHRVYVMAQGGRAIYEGPPTSLLSTLLEHSSISSVCQLDQLNENPAIVAIEVASGEYGPNVVGELALHHEQQMYEDYANSLAGGSDYGMASPGLNGTPYSTPKVSARGMSSPRSPISATPRFGFRKQRAASLGGGQLFKMDSSISLAGQAKQTTPILPAKSRILQQHYKLDNLSNVTSLSYASTYDAELPVSTSHLIVDKRLRRSVVMKSAYWRHTYTLMKRCWLLTTRDLFLMGVRILGFLLVAGGIVQIFRHALDPSENQCPMYQSEISDIRQFMFDTKARLFNIANQLKQASSTHLFFFHLGLCITMVTSALSGLIFPFQMRMFLREYKNGWYSPASFVTSTTLAELPVDIIGPTITLLITYPLCNQPQSPYYWREIGYILVIVIGSIVCKSQAQIVGAFLMDSVENSVFMSCVMVTPHALLSGIAVRISSMNWFLQLVSYGSFLRYTFESLFLIRYGYDMCPCDKELIYGYPTNTSADLIPDYLNKMVKGFIELNKPELINGTTNQIMNNNTGLVLAESAREPDDADVEGNLFIRFMRLISASNNQFVPKLEDLGDCSTYRSLYLIDMGIEDRTLYKWILILLILFFLSRIITYFVVKTVIKMR